VIEDAEGLLYVFELISPGQVPRREEMAATLEALSARGLQTIPKYLPSLNGDYIVFHGSDICQLSPCVEGIELVRPGYIFEEWRGVALANFLVAMRDKAHPSLPLTKSRPFSILAFIDDMLRKMPQSNPDIAEKTADIIDFLNADFRHVHDRLPVIFCHGDFHPLNVIWSKNGISAVIDWEFMGIKPEFYDVANLIGCVGMEYPHGLTGDLTINFLITLDNARFLSPTSRQYLPEAVIALRFAWLSVWLRNGDQEMIAMETRYLRILYQNLADLKYSWGCE